MSKEKDDFKLSWTERWRLAILFLIAGMAFQFGQWLVDTFLPNIK
jgi:hypothetical protein